MIPSINFELILLKEIYNTSLSPIIHALHNGKIVRDNKKQLSFYKSFASFLFSNRRFIVPCTTSKLNFLVQASEKLILDYKKRDSNSLESFILFSQIIDLIIDLELLFNLGWTTNGKTKIKLLERVNSKLFEHLNSLFKEGFINPNRKNMGNELLNSHLHKYKEIIDNNRLPSINYKYWWNDKLAIKTADKTKISELCEILAPYINKGLCHIYFLYDPFKNYKFAAHILVIDGDNNFLMCTILPILKNERLKDSSIQSCDFPLIETFNGGAQALKISEDFYYYLSSCLINGKGEGLSNLKDIDANIIAINIIFIYSKLQSDTDLRVFFQYLFDGWITYSYNEIGISLNEVTDIRKKVLNDFAELYISQKESLVELLGSISLFTNNKNEEEKWQRNLMVQLIELSN